jgi:8-oxo-dGTP diphosphatase
VATRKSLPPIYIMKKGIDYTGIAVCYFCHDGNGNFVMAKRNKNCRDEHDTWDIGGGALEFGDKIEERLKKEIKEEYCTDVIDYEFIGFDDVHRTHLGKKTHWIALNFKVLVDRRKVKIGEPHKFDDLQWVTLKNLPKKLHSELPGFFKRYHEKLLS